MSKRRTFTDEFKTMIAELVLSGQSVKDVASAYSLSETAVRNWSKKKAPINVEEGDTTSSIFHIDIYLVSPFSV